MPSTSEEPEPLEPAAEHATPRAPGGESASLGPHDENPYAPPEGVDDAAPAAVAAHDPYLALRNPSLRNYLAGNVLAIVGMQMEMLAIRWELYERTGDQMMLGYVGLAQVVPVISLVLLSGHAADRFDRKSIVLVALLTMTASALGLVAISLTHGPLLAIYFCLALNGAARAFMQPARQALLPQLVEPKHFSNAVTWNAGGYHLASVVGPAIGGVLLAMFQSPALIYGLNAAAALVYFCLLLSVRPRAVAADRREVSFDSLLAGVRYVWRTEIVFGALALDMFAVLLGGATTLLPVFAKDILQVGPSGLGWLEAAPAFGALAMSVALAHRPPMHRAGHRLLWAVAAFGVTMILFGLSRSFVFSLVVLFVSGAVDNISVVIRQTLVQLQTPESMRGRVSAVNSLFISTSNELGGFESGVTAAWFGTVGSVVGGGVGALLVVMFAAWRWPRLRGFDRLDEAQSPAPAPAASSA